MTRSRYSNILTMKWLFMFMTAIVLIVAMVTFAIPEKAEAQVECELRYGDSDLDGDFDVDDYFALLDILDGEPPPMPEPGTDAFIASDVNGEGVLTFDDLILFEDYLVGAITVFPADVDGDGCVIPAPTLPPDVSDALGDASVDPADVPTEVIDSLVVADELGLLETITPGETVNQNYGLGADAVVVVGNGGTIDGNVLGDPSSTVVVGENGTVDGNVSGIGTLFIGGANVNINGNIDVSVTELIIGPGASVNFIRNVAVDTLRIEAAGEMTTNKNLTINGSLDMEANTFLTVNGNFTCDPAVVINVHENATVTVGGNNNCPGM